MFSFFKWFFSVSGIQCTTTKPARITFKGKMLLYFNSLPGVVYTSQGPTTKDVADWLKWGKVLREYKCSICGTRVWSYKSVKVCGKFSCFRKNGGKWC